MPSEEILKKTEAQHLVHLDSVAKPDILLETVIGACRNASIKFSAAKNATRNREKKTIEDNLDTATKNYAFCPNDANLAILEAAQADSTSFLTAKAKLEEARYQSSVILLGDRPSKWYIDMSKHFRVP